MVGLVIIEEVQELWKLFRQDQSDKDKHAALITPQRRSSYISFTTPHTGTLVCSRSLSLNIAHV
jgi:hypothetical protein